MMQRVERTFAGRPLSIETGRMAKQAAGSALVTYGNLDEGEAASRHQADPTTGRPV